MQVQTIYKSVTAGFLLLLFAVPTFVPALHEYFQHHEHSHCTAKDVRHFHDHEMDCELCDYLLTIKPYYQHEYRELTEPASPLFGNELEVSLRDRSPEHGIFSRGPPVC